MRMADTSVLYALFSDGDVHHEEAVRRMSDPETILVPTEIWSETICLIHQRQGFDAAVLAGEDLMALPHVEFLSSRVDITRASWLIFCGANGNLSLADCFLLSWCMSRDASPLSFDGRIVEYFRMNRQAKG